MKNPNLYIHPKVNCKPITKRRYTPKATVSMPKAKRPDVPRDYRRNRKQDAVSIALLIASGLALFNCILFFASL